MSEKGCNSESIVIKQRMFYEGIHFEFGKEKLKYTHKYSTNSRTFMVDYGAIDDGDFEELTEQSHFFTRLGVGLIIGGLGAFLGRC